MQVAHTPYVYRHINEMIQAAQMNSSHSTLEIGAGLGKFSIPLIQQGFNLTCLDLSPVMLEKLAHSTHLPVATLACDAADVAHHTDQFFDRAIGFFTLHHMNHLEAVFKGIKSRLKPGARIAFCEPVAWNPLYYIQISLTPGMTWGAEKGIINMTPRKVLGLLQKVGFVDCSSFSYGFFPPFIVNRGLGQKIESGLEKITPFRVFHAFQIFTGKTPA